MSRHLFSTFDVTKQVFHTTKLSLAIVNLKPLLPGRKSIQPHQIPHETGQNPSFFILGMRVEIFKPNGDEVTDLFLAVQAVGRVVERAYEAEGLTISVQDGKSAGQSVPHVHVHILPRFSTDFNGNNDDIYPALESAEQALKGNLEDMRNTGTRAARPSGEIGERPGDVSGTAGAVGRDWEVAKDEDRRPRGVEEMEKEAEWLRGLF